VNRLVAVGIAGMLIAASSNVSALSQPDNTVIPVGNGLQALFDSRGEAINALNDALTLPETFTPSCDLSFEVLERNAGYLNTFGWYNIGPNAPANNSLYEFLACNDGVGTIKTLNIGNDPLYLGGDIGFYQGAGPQPCPPGPNPQNHESLFYSQKGYNPDGTQQNPFIHLLIYNSTVVPNAFYFCWEDLLVGGDNDFDDLVTFVTGITCTGGGGACQTGQLGICADGAEQCQNGQLECIPLNQAGTETCDGLDNDCDGEPDEGEICPDGFVCDKGSCVPVCSGGEFTCPADKICNGDGICVDPTCVDVTCPSGTKCVQGLCQAPCDGVVCPYDQVCLVGACVDPCDVLTCDPGQLCVSGVCSEECQCAGCPMGATCQMDGLCLDDDCIGVDCPAGSHCDNGTCVDDCDGAVCPSAQTCVMGTCIDDPGGGGGGAGGGNMIDLGGSDPGTGGSDVGGANAGGNSLVGGSSGNGSGCGCRVVGPSDADPRLAWLALAALAMALGRRRRLRGSRCRCAAASTCHPVRATRARRR
jgi:MYXO-CTERM domain-containing protein